MSEKEVEEEEGSEDESDEGGKEGKRPRRPPWRIILVFFIIIVAIFLKLPVVTQEHHPEEFPVNVTVTMVEVRQENTTQCQPRDYNWTYRWDGWDPQLGDVISPRFFLRNGMDLSGEYEVQFAFFDDRVYRFEDYSTKETTSETLPWGASAMSSARTRVLVGPSEEVRVAIPTQKKDPTSTYWTYADVVAPKYDFCGPLTIARNMTVQKDVVKYITVNQSTCTVRYEYWWRRAFN
ncbi:MAG: hypothetical protein V1735_02855 [Nanoarchaeota archaeon]